MFDFSKGVFRWKKTLLSGLVLLPFLVLLVKVFRCTMMYTNSLHCIMKVGFHLVCLKRKPNGLVCRSVLAWLLCPCCLSVRLCSLVFLGLAVFWCFCSACVWAAGCVAAQACCCCTDIWGSVLYFLLPLSCFRGLGWSVSLRGFPLVHFMSFHAFCFTCIPNPLFLGAGCVCGPSQKT